MNVSPSPLEKATPKVNRKQAQLKLVVGGQNPQAGPKARYASSGLGLALSLSLHILVVGLTIFFSSHVSTPLLVADSPRGAGLSLFPGMEISLEDSFSGGSASESAAINSPEKTPKERLEHNLPPTTGELPPLESVVKEKPILKVKKAPQPVKKDLQPSNESQESTPSDSLKSDTASSSNQGAPNNDGSSASGVEGGAKSGDATLPGGGGTLDTPVSYQQAIAAHLSRHKKYPEQARMRGLEGQVMISLTLGKGGDVRDFQILNSDSEILSGGAKSMVERASPFPNIPDELAADWITLKLPIRFNLY